MDNDASVNKEKHTGESERDNAGQSVTDIDQVLRYDYNLKGELIQTERDNNVDGKYDYLEFYTLDTNGYRLQKEIDLTNDGKFDKKELYKNNPTGGITETEYYNILLELNENKDMLTQIQRYTLNANNNIVRTETELPNGNVNSVNYDLDEYGRISKAHFDTSNDTLIDRIETYIRNENGYVTQVITTDGQDQFISKQDRLLDAVGRVLKNTFDYNNDGQPNRIIENKYDEWGNIIEYFNDRSGNGVTNDDIIYLRTYNTLQQLESEIGINPVTKNRLNVSSFEYDEVGFNTKIRNDRDLDGKISSSEDRIIEFTPNPIWNRKATETQYDGTNKLLHKEYIEYDNAGIITLTFRDNLGDGTINRMEFGNYAGQYTKNHSEDLTTWSSERINYIQGLSVIMLSSPTFESTVTLDSATIAKIAPTNNTIRITYGNDKDTVNLIGFTQSEVNADQYTTEVDGETYIVRVDASTEVILG